MPWGSYAGSQTAVVPSDAPAMDVAAMLSAQPRRSHRRKQEEVERGAGLEEQTVSTYLRNLCGGTHKNQRYFKTVKELAAAGIYRVLGGKRPRRVWWLAFTGKGGAEPRFNAREEVHAFTAEEDSAVAELMAAPETAGTARETLEALLQYPKAGGYRASGTAARGGCVGIDETSFKLYIFRPVSRVAGQTFEHLSSSEYFLDRGGGVRELSLKHYI